MNQGEAKMLETEVVIFPMEFDREKKESDTDETVTAEVAADKQSIKTDLEIRFARLKRSLRKRSASIL